MQTLTPQEEGACVGTEMSGEQPLPICRTGDLNPPGLTSRRSQPPLPLRLQSTPRVGGGSAFFVRPLTPSIMKTILITLGTICLILIMLAVIGRSVAVVKSSSLDKQSKAYVDGAVPRILSNWDESEFLSRVSPEFTQAVDKQELDKLYTSFRKLGKLRTYEGSKGQSSVIAVYTCKADFDTGPADIKVSLIQHGGRWEIAGFDVNVHGKPAN